MKFRAFVGRTKLIGDDKEASTWKYAKVVAIIRGSEVVRYHVLRLLKESIKPKSISVHFLSDVEESIWKLLSYTSVDLRIVFWEKNSMSDEEIDEFLKQVGRLDNFTVILDESDQIYRGFQRKRAEFDAPWVRGKFIDCSFAKMEVTKGEATTKRKLYEYWLGEVEKLNISSRLIEHFSESPFLETFNTLDALKYVGERDYNLITAEKWGVLWVDREREVMRKLLYKGRGAMKNVDWRDLNSGRFFWLLFREIVLLMKAKTAYKGGRGYNEQVIPRETYYRIKGNLSKVDLKQLYRRLYLVTSLMKWREHPGSVSLLILHW